MTLPRVATSSSRANVVPPRVLVGVPTVGSTSAAIPTNIRVVPNATVI